MKKDDFDVEIIASILFFFLAAWAAMGLWNAILPSLFGLGRITYWQMCGLILLVRLMLTRKILD